MDRKQYSLHQRNGVWQIRFTATIKGKNILIRESLHTRDRDEAVALANERAKEIYESCEFKLNKNKLKEYTIDQAFGFYYEEHGQFSADPKKTLRDIKLVARYFDKDLPFCMLSEDEVSTFVRVRRQEKASNATINKNLTLLTSIWNFCKKRRIAVPDIEMRTFKLKARSIRTVYLEDTEDLQKIIGAAPDWFKPIIKFAVLTGFRANNILDLKWEDISATAITIVKKNCKYEDGEVQIKMLFPELQELLDSLPRCSEYVFIKDGKRIPYNTMQKHWMKLFKNIDVKYINFHGLRHTHATWLLKKTNNIKLVSDSLGHSNINITTRYAHLIKSEEAQIMQQAFAL